MTDCARALSLVEKLSDGEATAAEKRAAESHLEHCSSCRSHLEFLVSLSREARSMFFPEPPESYWEHLPRRVLDRIESETRQSSGGGFWSRLLAPSMLRWGALGATLMVLVTVGVAFLREESGTLTPPPPLVTSATPSESRAEPQEAAERTAPPPMARDEAAPAPARLGSDADAGEGAPPVAEAVSPAAPAESARGLEETEVTQAQDRSERRKENVQSLTSANRPRAAAAPAALSRAVALEACDDLRRAVAAMGDGPDRNDVRYRLASCSLERHEREASEELLQVAIEDAEAFLAVEGQGPRADEIRARLERVRH